MRGKYLFLVITCAVMAIGPWSVSRADDTVFSCGFESGLEGCGGWQVSNGVWDLGLSPMAGPGSPHTGYFCAATMPNGNYDPYQDSRLISPSINLPSVNGSEELWLKFWQWFSYSTYDAGYVQISVWNPGTSAWSAWTTVSGSIVNVSNGWSLLGVDLTKYAGSSVRIGFYHVADRNVYGDASESTGWYIDDIEIVRTVPAFTGTFESGWSGWTADCGVWQIGAPTSGPGSAHSGTQCAATVLAGNYPAYTDSRLVDRYIITFTILCKP